LTPFHTPVFVLTKQVREPWERPGGTTFYFVNDRMESALRQAREVAAEIVEAIHSPLVTHLRYVVKKQ
jgi:hypothetical protein